MRIMRFFLPGMLGVSLCVLLMLGAGPARSAVSIPEENLSALTPLQWDSLFTLASGLPLSQRVAFWGDLAAIDTRYVLGPLGEGSGQTPDAGPLHDFAHVDCLTYVEQVYALAQSRSYADFPAVLQRIRYRDGRVDFRWRNHYTVSDWLPANVWFIHDVTDEVGAGLLHSMTKTISRAKFFADKGLPQYGNIPNETMTTQYIPRAKVHQMLGKLHTGDMVIFIIDTPGIFAGHVGFIRVKDGTVYLQHAGQIARKVQTLPLLDYLKIAPARTVGCKFARLN